MIDILNKPIKVSSFLDDDKLVINIEEHTLYFDNIHEFNKTFISHVKRGNGFKENEIKEPSTTRALYNLSKKFKIKKAYDIGCENLYTTLQIAKIFDCDVTGFDIHKEAIDAGLCSLKLNSDLSLDIIERGVGSKDKNNTELNELPGVDLIMIDIEGYQHYVFQDGMENIKNSRPIIVYETDSRIASLFVRPDKEILKPLEDIDYKFYYSIDHRKNKPFEEITCNDILEQDGLLILIPEEKL
jgi:hypothetical protein